VLELPKIYLGYCKNNKEELELSNYFQQFFFYQQTAPPRRFRPWPGASRTPPLLRHCGPTLGASAPIERICYMYLE